MALAALAEPQRVKISSKRQITIPAQWYREMGFNEYALCTWTDEGLLLQPLDIQDKDITVDILRQLIAQGYEGDALLDEYQAIKRKIISVKELINEAENDVENGRTAPAQDMVANLRAKYGLHSSRGAVVPPDSPELTL